MSHFTDEDDKVIHAVDHHNSNNKRLCVGPPQSTSANDDDDDDESTITILTVLRVLPPSELRTYLWTRLTPRSKMNFMLACKAMSQLAKQAFIRRATMKAPIYAPKTVDDHIRHGASLLLSSSSSTPGPSRGLFGGRADLPLLQRVTFYGLVDSYSTLRLVAMLKGVPRASLSLEGAHIETCAGFILAGATQLTRLSLVVKPFDNMRTYSSSLADSLAGLGSLVRVSLDMRHLCKVTRMALCKVLTTTGENLKQLKHLEVKLDGSSDEAQVLCANIGLMRPLESLALRLTRPPARGSRRLLADGLASSLAKQAPSLRELSLRGFKLTKLPQGSAKSIFAALAACSSLSKLTLANLMVDCDDGRNGNADDDDDDDDDEVIHIDVDHDRSHYVDHEGLAGAIGALGGSLTELVLYQPGLEDIDVLWRYLRNVGRLQRLASLTLRELCAPDSDDDDSDEFEEGEERVSDDLSEFVTDSDSDSNSIDDCVIDDRVDDVKKAEAGYVDPIVTGSASTSHHSNSNNNNRWRVLSACKQLRSVSIGKTVLFASFAGPSRWGHILQHVPSLESLTVYGLKGQRDTELFTYEGMKGARDAVDFLICVAALPRLQRLEVWATSGPHSSSLICDEVMDAIIVDCFSRDHGFHALRELAFMAFDVSRKTIELMLECVCVCNPGHLPSLSTLRFHHVAVDVMKPDDSGKVKVKDLCAAYQAAGIRLVTRP
jgi:hypothetical protein